MNLEITDQLINQIGSKDKIANLAEIEGIREKLVKQLESGFELSITDVNNKPETVIFTVLTEKNTLTLSITRKSDYKEIGYIDTNLINGVADNILKKIVDQEYQGIGLMKLATSLLFEVLIYLHIHKVRGIIRVDNYPSVYSRINAQALLQHGYYKTTFKGLRPNKQKPSGFRYLVTTHLDQIISHPNKVKVHDSFWHLLRLINKLKGLKIDNTSQYGVQKT